MIRLCRRKGDLPRMSLVGVRLEVTTLPGTGYRCVDHDTCAIQVYKFKPKER